MYAKGFVGCLHGQESIKLGPPLTISKGYY